MVARKRKKSTRMRGSFTHGWGEKKKHRGAGHRGGRGRAGTGKRCDSKKPSVWKNTKYFGKHGYKKKNAGCASAPINLSAIDDNAVSWVKRKLAEEKDGAVVVDLEKIGCGKLLSAGKVTRKLVIKAQKASAKAVEKVAKAGGKVELPAGAKPEAKKEQ
jgi:large subunit ribosomal protein L15